MRFPTLFVARSSPDTGNLPSTILPICIERLVLNPNVPWADELGAVNISFESFITMRDGLSLAGD